MIPAEIEIDSSKFGPETVKRTVLEKIRRFLEAF